MRSCCSRHPPKDRNPAASWAIHMQHANKPNRVELVAAAVNAGRTSDEERAFEASQSASRTKRKRWLLAIDVNYHVTRMWASGAEAEAAKEVSQWFKRTVERLKEKGLTDAVCCFDSRTSFRKELTKEWEDRKYKDRATKDPELGQQLILAEQMLSEFCCVKKDGLKQTISWRALRSSLTVM